MHFESFTYKIIKIYRKNTKTERFMAIFKSTVDKDNENWNQVLRFQFPSNIYRKMHFFPPYAFLTLVNEKPGFAERIQLNKKSGKKNSRRDLFIIPIETNSSACIPVKIEGILIPPTSITKIKTFHSRSTNDEWNDRSQHPEPLAVFTWNVTIFGSGCRGPGLLDFGAQATRFLPPIE